MSVTLLQCPFYAPAGILIAMQSAPCKRWAGLLNCFSLGSVRHWRVTPVRLGHFGVPPKRTSLLSANQIETD